MSELNHGRSTRTRLAHQDHMPVRGHSVVKEAAEVPNVEAQNTHGGLVGWFISDPVWTRWTGASVIVEALTTAFTRSSVQPVRRFR